MAMILAVIIFLLTYFKLLSSTWQVRGFPFDHLTLRMLLYKRNSDAPFRQSEVFQQNVQIGICLVVFFYNPQLPYPCVPSSLSEYTLGYKK